MLEPTKKHPPDIIELCFRGPAANRKQAAQMLKKLGFVDTSESIPWREAFSEYSEQDGPVVCLKAIRRREGLTQKKLAEKSGIPQSHVSLMERGKMRIGVTRAKKLGKALNTGYKVFL
jgi:DNA-binding XRE family transcriptional regulator